MKSYKIPTNFRIPKEFKERYILTCVTGRIEIRRGGEFKLDVRCRGEFAGVNASDSLDWLGFVVETIRFECGNL